MTEWYNRFPFALHPGYAMDEKMSANLPKKTGRTLDEWIGEVRKSGPKDTGATKEWLVDRFSLSGGFAGLIARASVGNLQTYEPVELLKNLFGDTRAGLIPLYLALMECCFALGADISASPCKTFVPISRNHVIAQIKPATKTRIDFGLALGNTPAGGLLIDTGGYAKKDRITHRIAVFSLADITGELTKWLHTAYALDAR